MSAPVPFGQDSRPAQSVVLYIIPMSLKDSQVDRIHIMRSIYLLMSSRRDSSYTYENARPYLYSACDSQIPQIELIGQSYVWSLKSCEASKFLFFFGFIIVPLSVKYSNIDVYILNDEFSFKLAVFVSHLVRLWHWTYVAFKWVFFFSCSSLIDHTIIYMWKICTLSIFNQ